MSTSQTKPGIFGVLSSWRPWLPKRTFLAVRLLALVSLVILSLASAVRTAPPGNPLSISVLGADSGKKSMLVAEGGWPLIIELSASNPLGIVTFNGVAQFPDLPLPLNEATPVTNPIDSIMSRAVGFLLFSNPDGGVDPGSLLSFPSLYYGQLEQPCEDPLQSMLKNINGSCEYLLPSDEKLLYFAIGNDVGTREIFWPAFNRIENSHNPLEDPFPPYGFSPRIPGLVILSDSGIGNFYREEGIIDYSYVLDSPGRARNLAAYIDSVGYFLRNYQGKTVVTASWVAPRNVISPYIERDSNIGGTCSDGDGGTMQTAIRINGGSQLEYIDMNPSGNLDLILQNLVIKLRIFVVNLNGSGPLIDIAPSMLEDLNNDGLVDSKDAVQAGYTLLSEEKTVLLRIASTDFFGNYVDLDGNLCVGPAVAPGGAGGLGRIPQ